MKTTRFLLAAGVSLALAFHISCSGDSNGGDDPVSSSSGGGGGAKVSSSSGGGGGSSGLEVSSSSSDALGSSSSGGEEPSVSSSSGGAKVSSSSGGGSSSSLEASSSSSDALSSSSVSSSSGGSSSSSSGDASSSSHVHVWGEWVTTTPATCSEAGEETRTCTLDGSVEKNPIPMIAYDAETHFCHDGELYSCGNKPYDPETHFCHDGELYSCGNKPYDPETHFCYNGKIGEHCGSRTATYNPDTYQCKPSVNANGIYLKTPVSYQGDSYEAVLIGTQTWLAKNLNYDADGSRCYGDNTGGDSQNRCGTYGRLYNWNTAMNDAASSSANPSGVQGVCPTGWHLPSDAEWDALIAFVHSDNGLAAYTSGTSTLAGKYLKAESGWNGTLVSDDKYGFSALPGGYNPDSFSGVGDNGYWWSSTQYNSGYAYNGYMNYNRENVYRSNGNKINLYSVRCVQD